MQNNSEFGYEWLLLELVCKGVHHHENLAQVQEILRLEKIHWGELIEQAIRHKVLPLLADAIISTQQTTDTAQDKEVHLNKAVPVMVAKFLQQALDVNKYKTGLFRTHALKIGKALEAEGITYCSTKGISFETTIYGGRGVRNFDHDIDFMVQQHDGEKVSEVLAGLGYQVGQYDPFKNVVNPMPRKELMIYKLHPDHLPPYVGLTSDPLVGAIGIDFSFSFTWFNSEYNVPLDKAFEKIHAITYPGIIDGRLFVFDYAYQFMFTALHLFREAWFERWIDFEQDVNLLKFTDLIRLWDAYKEQVKAADFTALVKAFGISFPVAWVMEHMDRAFGTTVVDDLGLHGFANEEMLFSAYGADGKERKWKGSMRRRLYMKEAGGLF